MKNCVLLENDYLPGDLERQIENFVDHDNNQRCPGSLKTSGPHRNRIGISDRGVHVA